METEEYVLNAIIHVPHALDLRIMNVQLVNI